MRLIDANVIREKLMEYIGLTNGFERAFSETPTIEIVRCKECKHYNAMTSGCKLNPSVEPWSRDDFCSYGIKENSDECNYRKFK